MFLLVTTTLFSEREVTFDQTGSLCERDFLAKVLWFSCSDVLPVTGNAESAGSRGMVFVKLEVLNWFHKLERSIYQKCRRRRRSCGRVDCYYWNIQKTACTIRDAKMA